MGRALQGCEHWAALRSTLRASLLPFVPLHFLIFVLFCLGFFRLCGLVGTFWGGRRKADTRFKQVTGRLCWPHLTHPLLPRVLPGCLHPILHPGHHPSPAAMLVPSRCPQHPTSSCSHHGSGGLEVGVDTGVAREEGGHRGLRADPTAGFCFGGTADLNFCTKLHLWDFNCREDEPCFHVERRVRVGLVPTRSIPVLEAPLELWFQSKEEECLPWLCSTQPAWVQLPWGCPSQGGGTTAPNAVTSLAQLFPAVLGTWSWGESQSLDATGLYELISNGVCQ